MEGVIFRPLVLAILSPLLLWVWPAGAKLIDFLPESVEPRSLWPQKRWHENGAVADLRKQSGESSQNRQEFAFKNTSPRDLRHLNKIVLSLSTQIYMNLERKEKKHPYTIPLVYELF